jgi:hypothetical protein
MKRRWEMGMRLAFAAVAAVLAASSARAEDVTYTRHIKPLFEAKCAGCHGGDSAPDHHAFKAEKEKWLSAGQGMRMDTYPHLVYFVGWPDTGALMRRLDDGRGRGDGQPGNMYRHLGTTEEERQANLKRFREWVGNWVLKRWP